MLEFISDTLILDSPGDSKMAEKLAIAIQDSIRNEAVQVIDLAQKEWVGFKKRVDDETTIFNGMIVHEYADEIVKNPIKFSVFVRQRDHIYQGPLNLNDTQEWAALTNKATDLAALSLLTQSQDGQSILLKRVFNSPEYTLAHLKRDLRVLQLHPPSRVKEADTLLTQLTTMVESAQKYAEKAKLDTETARTETISITQKKYKNFQDTVLSILAGIHQSRKSGKEKMIAELSQASLSTETGTHLGPQMQALIASKAIVYTLDLTKYVTDCLDPTRLDVATPSDFETAESYSKLLNQENIFLPISFKIHEKEGTDIPRVRHMPIIAFDFARMESDRTLVQGAYNTAYATEKIDFSGNPGGAYRGSYSIPELRARVAYAKSRSDDAYRRYGGEGPQPYILAAIHAYKGLPEAANAAIGAKESELAQRFQINRRIGVR